MFKKKHQLSDGFGSTVGLHEHTVPDSVNVSKDELRLLYTIPESMCDSILPSSNADKERVRFLSLGGMLALCDEVTTYLLLAIDKTHRPGQSVQLSGEINRQLTDSITMGGKLSAGQTVLCVANCSKIGENLSFTSMRIYSYQQHGSNRTDETAEDKATNQTSVRRDTDANVACSDDNNNATATGASSESLTSKIDLSKYTLLANTRHIKFMKMGYLWDSVIGDCLPLIIHLYKKWRPNHFFIKNIVSSSGEDGKSSAKSGLSNAHKLLDTITLEKNVKEEIIPTSPASSTKQPKCTHSSFILKTNPTFLNPMGKIHGGVIAMAAFTAAYEALNFPSNNSSSSLATTSSSNSSRTKSEINSMEISYMSACQQGKIKINVAPGDGGDLLEGSSICSSDSISSKTLVVELFSTASLKMKRKSDKATSALAPSDGFSKTPAVTAVVKL